MTDLFQRRFLEWLDEALSVPLPGGILAFNFNLYESSDAHELELIGAATYSSEDPDWACDDIFMSGEPRFRLPHSLAGRKWEEGLDFAIKLLRLGIASNRPGATRLREARAVTVGFVDGELVLVWSNGAMPH